MSVQLFRKAALEKLSSPDQLDDLVQITTPKGWISLIFIAVLLVSVMFWSILGKIPRRVYGEGILIRPGGVFSVEADSTGLLAEILVAPGDRVRKGQVVARISKPKLRNQITEARAELADLAQKHEALLEYLEKDDKSRQSFFRRKRGVLRQGIRNKEEILQSLEKQGRSGGDSRYDKVAEELQDSRSELVSLELAEFQHEQQLARQRNESAFKLEEQRRRVRQLLHREDQDSRIISHMNGRVLEVMRSIGDFIQEGTSILNLERSEDNQRGLEAVIYLPPEKGNQLKPGMPVYISPYTVQTNTHGFLLGAVDYVAEYPATTEGMMRVIGNAKLVNVLAGQGAYLEVSVKLSLNSETESGYQWTTPKGPPMKLQSGTLCGAAITISTEKPIALVLPKLSF